MFLALPQCTTRARECRGGRRRIKSTPLEARAGTCGRDDGTLETNGPHYAALHLACRWPAAHLSFGSIARRPRRS